ncbi:hypothetical protein BLA29_011569 [Euroglyphus maynei]|uniref:Uncharacterized protein n=1 Tax=Euroglyphus maynei TaxID=6958 RepID=A0A1Y3ANL3_EURMA|nr:hypothetical protein BLA29_011569 [Euroglyphus maynei]
MLYYPPITTIISDHGCHASYQFFSHCDYNSLFIHHYNSSNWSSIPRNFVPFELKTFFGQRVSYRNCYNYQLSNFVLFSAKNDAVVNGGGGGGGGCLLF